MNKLFISYRSLDSTNVDAIVKRLNSLKRPDGAALYRVWQDKYGIPPGQDWWQSIVDAIIDCEVLVFMVSRESVGNPNCRAELSYARKRNRPVLPVVLEGEFTHNPVTGKNDIDYWDSVPDELNDLRAQFLFYEGAGFYDKLAAALAKFAAEPQRWVDFPADRPSDPREASDASNSSDFVYDEACDYAWRMEFNTAEKLFQKLVNWNDPDFRDEAAEWIGIVREYQRIQRFAARRSTRHKAVAEWPGYRAGFPRSFTPLFDPDNLAAALTEAPKPPTAPPPPPAPRKPTSTDLLPAPFAWLPVTAGRVTLEQGGYLSKKDTTFDVAAFEIAKYPLTNAQYRLFVEAGGYRERRWWTGAGWAWRDEEGVTEPRLWTDAKWNGAAYPVVGVSFYEAVAYCQWLSEATGEAVSLPTEQQWQRAAQGDDKREYPWGKDFDKARCNTRESGIGRTTEVTAYQGKGESPFGALDMAGNVWEWTRTVHASGDIQIDIHDESHTTRRVLRGGSWGANRVNARAAARTNSFPDLRDDFSGFRVVRPPSQLQP